VRVQAPDLLQDFIARDGPVGIRGKIAKQLAFADGQLIALAPPRGESRHGRNQ
jgi:hypothetical protein